MNRLFMKKQPAFSCCTTGVPPDAAGRRDDPVAGNENGERILFERSPYRPRGTGMPDAPGQFAVRDRLTEGDAPNRLPHGTLKLGTLQGQGQHACSAWNGEVLFKLAQSSRSHRGSDLRLAHMCGGPLQDVSLLHGEGMIAHGEEREECRDVPPPTRTPLRPS